MDINSFSAAKLYGAAQRSLATTGEKSGPMGGGEGESFDPRKILADTVSSVTSGEKTATDFMLGKADPHSVVEALASAELAVETAVTLRNRVVEAYQELMRMPI